MKILSLLVAAISLFVCAPLPAHAAMEVIYRVSGVTDDGSNIFEGVATAIHCTNFSGEVVRLNITFFKGDGTKHSSHVGDMAPGTTTAKATHGIVLFNAGVSPNGIVKQGSALVAASSRRVHCSAMIMDAASVKPDGVALNMVRYNPAPGSAE
jgi:hypothetical protein